MISTPHLNQAESATIAHLTIYLLMDLAGLIRGMPIIPRTNST
jgi:hypothetical protein